MKHIDVQPGDRVVAYLKADDTRRAGMIAEFSVVEDDGLLLALREDPGWRLPDFSDGWPIGEYHILARVEKAVTIRYSDPHRVVDDFGVRIVCHATVDPHRFDAGSCYEQRTDPSGRYIGALHYDIGTVRLFDPVAVMAEALRRAMAYEEAGDAGEGAA